MLGYCVLWGVLEAIVNYNYFCLHTDITRIRFPLAHDVRLSLLSFIHVRVIRYERYFKTKGSLGSRADGSWMQFVKRLTIVTPTRAGKWAQRISLLDWQYKAYCQMPAKQRGKCEWLAAAHCKRSFREWYKFRKASIGRWMYFPSTVQSISTIHNLSNYFTAIAYVDHLYGATAHNSRGREEGTA